MIEDLFSTKSIFLFPPSWAGKNMVRWSTAHDYTKLVWPFRRTRSLIQNGNRPPPPQCLRIGVHVSWSPNSTVLHLDIYLLSTNIIYIDIWIYQDVKVSQRKARERNRVQSVNHGFDMLKRHIPTRACCREEKIPDQYSGVILWCLFVYRIDSWL